MSRRTFPRVAAAGLLAVLGLTSAPVVAADSPNPWRGTIASNPWRDVTVAVAPAPRPVVQDDFELYIELPAAQPVPQVYRQTVPACASGSCQPPAVVGQRVRPAGITLPNPSYLQHPPQYYPPEPFTAVPPPPWPIPEPPPEVRRMMVGTLDQMLHESRAGAPWLPPPPPPQPMMIASGWAPQGYTLTTPPQPPVPPRGQMPVGTWHRDMGPIHYAVAIKDGHLALTCTMSEEGVSINHTLTADCYLTRNGSELVGLITSFDISFDGKPVALDDLQSMAEDIPKVQKELAEKPFALSFRMYDDTLVIGNVRLPSAKEGSDISGIFGLMAGRYKQSQGRPPAPRTVLTVPACDSQQCVPVQIQPVEWEVPQAWPQQVPPLPPVPYPQRIR